MLKAGGGWGFILSWQQIELALTPVAGTCSRDKLLEVFDVGTTFSGAGMFQAMLS